MRDIHRSLLGALTLMLITRPARAQTQPVITLDDHRSIADITASVSIEGPGEVNLRPKCETLGLPCGSSQEFPDGGLALAVSVYPVSAVAIVGELSTYFNHWEAFATKGDYVPPPGTGTVNETNHVSSALGGLRVRTPLISCWGSHARFFAQALVGPQWSDIRSEQRVFQPGAGIEGYLRNSLGIRVQADYRFAPDDRRDLSTSRFSIGISIPVGER